MKKQTIFFLLLSCVMFGAGFLLVFTTIHRLPSPIHARGAVGREDDPAARARFEWMRLHSPSSGRIPEGIREKELAFASHISSREQVSASRDHATSKLSAIQSVTWSHRGPYNVGGRTRALAFDVSNENIILAGGVSGGMWRSIDGGASWTQTTASSVLHSVSCLAQDRRAAAQATWYYGTGEYQGNSTSGGGAFFRGDGIFKSIDGGVTWSSLASTASGTPHLFDNFFDFVWNVATDPSNLAQAEVYAATYGAIQRSVDGGTSWTIVLGGGGSPYSSFTDIAVASNGVAYATLSGGSSAAGIWRSADGTAWTKISPSGWPATFSRIVIGIAPSNENVVYFLAETQGSGTNNHSIWKYTYLSGDGSGAGGSWQDRSANLPAYGSPVGNFDSQGSYDLIVKVKPNDENTIYIGGTNLYRSTDGFATSGSTTWIAGYNPTNDISRYPNHHPDQHSLAFLPSNPSVLISGHDGGISKTTNDLASPIVWTMLNNGYMTTQFYTVAIDHATNGNNIVVGGLQDNGTWFSNSTNAGAVWAELFSGDGSYCAIANGRSSYYVSAQNAYTFRQVVDDNGVVSTMGRVDPTGGSNYLFINPFVLDPNNSNMMYLVGGSTLWRNSDLTAIPLGSGNTTNVNWTLLSNSTVTGSAITAIAVSTTPANRVYYGTHDGKLRRLDGANAGDPSPTDISTGLGLPANAYVSSIAIDPTNGDNVLAVFSNYEVPSLFYSNNGGASWTGVSGNLEQNPDGSGNGPSCRWASILPLGGTTTYLVGTSTGLYSTESLSGGSTSWMQEGAATIGNVVVDMIDTRMSDGLAVVGTHGNGVFSTNFTGGGGSTVELSYDDGTPSTGVYEILPNTDWILANRITAPSTQVKITKISFYITGDHAGGDGSFVPVIYASATGNPGTPAATPLYTGSTVVPSVGWNHVDLSGANVSLSGVSSAEFFVGAKYNGTTEPLIGADGTANSRAWEYDPTLTLWTAIDPGSFPVTLFIRATVQTLTDVRELPGTLPKEFTLEQNYPNPFNPSTTLRFALPQSGYVSLKIYNSLGQEVKTLLAEAMTAGAHEIQWDGSTAVGDQATSGMYVAFLQSGNGVQSRKMLLIR